MLESSQIGSDRKSATPSGVALARAPEEAEARLAARYWRRNLMLIAVLLALGFAVSFIGPFWAQELSGIRFFGWPLPFYLGAQGSILVYLIVVIAYAVIQNRSDASYQKALAALRNPGVMTDHSFSAMPAATTVKRGNETDHMSAPQALPPQT